MRFKVADDRLIAQIRGCGAKRILDVGCGNGRFARRAELAGFDVTGVDPAAIVSDGKSFCPIKSRLQDFRSAISFDAVVLQFVLHSLNPKERTDLFNQLLTKHLKPGGTVVVMDFGKPGSAMIDKVFWAGICFDEFLTILVEGDAVHFKNFRQFTSTPFIPNDYALQSPACAERLFTLLWFAWPQSGRADVVREFSVAIA